MYIRISLCHERIQFLKLKSDSQNWVYILIRLKATAPPLKKPHCVNPSRRVVQSSRVWAARGVYSLFHDWRKHNAREEEKNNTPKELTVLVLCFPKCLRNVYEGRAVWVRVCVSVCVRVCFPVLSSGFALEMWFLLSPRKRTRGAVLGDETAVAMAGCNTSSRCGVRMDPLCVSRHVKGGNNEMAPSSQYLFFDWKGWMRRLQNARCAPGLKVDQTESLLNSMVEYGWSILWFDPTVLGAVLHFLLFSPQPIAFEQV